MATSGGFWVAIRVEVPEEEYYEDYGPPIVTYYPPPWQYAYLYDWVPSPFWWRGIGFGGFFILGDFDMHGHHHRFTNHVRNANGTVSRVDAVTRTTGTGNSKVLLSLAREGRSVHGTETRSSSTPAGAGRSAQGSRIGSAYAQAGTRTIMNRQTGPRTENAISTLTKPQNLASSGSSRDMGNTGGTLRNPVTATRNMGRFASAGHPGIVSQGAVQRSASFNGRTFSSAPSARSFSGSGYRAGAGGGFRGGGGMGGFHGSGFGGGGGHGGGGHR